MRIPRNSSRHSPRELAGGSNRLFLSRRQPLSNRSRQLQIVEIRRVVRNERCSESTGKRGDQEIRIVVRPSAMTSVCPEAGGLRPHGSIVVDPAEAARERTELLQLPIRGPIAQAAPQFVKDDWTHENVIVTIDGIAEMSQGDSISAQDLADDVGVEDEACHSVIERAQAGARAAQQRLEFVPPLLSACIRLSGDSPEPAAERVVLAADSAAARRPGAGSSSHGASLSMSF